MVSWAAVQKHSFTNNCGTTMKKFLVLSVLFTLTACTYFLQREVKIIHLQGSDTMLQLAQSWAGAYMEQVYNVSLYVKGGGSATGFTALTDGSADIALSSRVINSHEAHILCEKYNQLGVSFLVAKDALSIYLNPENPVSDLSLAQLKGIFSGTITNWKELGGLNEQILVVIRPPTSGTYYYFKSHVLQNEAYLSNATTLPTTTKIVAFVRNRRNSIGYGGIAYGKEVKHARIENVAANEENVRLNKYPLSRYLYLYTINKPKGHVKDFIDWILSAQGQKIVQRVGYISLWDGH